MSIKEDSSKLETNDIIKSNKDESESKSTTSEAEKATDLTEDLAEDLAETGDIMIAIGTLCCDQYLTEEERGMRIKYIVGEDKSLSEQEKSDILAALIPKEVSAELEGDEEISETEGIILTAIGSICENRDLTENEKDEKIKVLINEQEELSIEAKHMILSSLIQKKSNITDLETISTPAHDTKEEAKVSIMEDEAIKKLNTVVDPEDVKPAPLDTVYANTTENYSKEENAQQKPKTTDMTSSTSNDMTSAVSVKSAVALIESKKELVPLSAPAHDTNEEAKISHDEDEAIETINTVLDPVHEMTNDDDFTNVVSTAANSDPANARRQAVYAVFRDAILTPDEKYRQIQALMKADAVTVDPESAKRQAVHAIFRNASLTPAEKHKEIQAIMNAPLFGFVTRDEKDWDNAALKADDQSESTTATETPEDCLSQGDIMDAIGAVCFNIRLAEDEKDEQIKAIVDREDRLSTIEKETILDALIPKTKPLGY